MRPNTITIAGAGLVGALLAIYLARRGYEVVVYEKRADLRSTPLVAGRSINLALANRGIRPLEQLGLMPQIRPMLVPMRGRMLHEEGGELTFMPYGHRPHEVIYSVSRRLNAVLLDAAQSAGRVRIHFEHALEQIDFERRQISIRHERSGETQVQPFELLIGADGAGSAVRKAMDEHWHMASTEEKLPHSYKELHLAPAPGGRFRMEKSALHIWPRGEFMMIGLPNPDGSFTMTLFLPDEGPVGFSALRHAEAFNAFFRRHFPDLLQLMPDAAASWLANPKGFLGTVHCPHWTVPNTAALIGDAAHAIVPFHGQGMNCGFEDSHELNALLDEHRDDWSATLPAYEARRRPNAEAIALISQENYLEMRAGVRDRQFKLKKAVGLELEKRHPDRFMPRYSMVMFHHLPYREALRRGQVNERILDKLTGGIERLEQVDWTLAERLLDDPGTEFA